MAQIDIGEINTQIRSISFEIGLSEVDQLKFRKLIYGFLGDRNESVIFEICKDITGKIDQTVVSFNDLYIAIALKKKGIRKLSHAVFDFIMTVGEAKYTEDCIAAFRAFLGSSREEADLKQLKNTLCSKFHALRVDLFEHYDTIRRNSRMIEDMSGAVQRGELDNIILDRWQDAEPPAPARYNNFVQLAVLLAFTRHDTRHRGYFHLIQGEEDVTYADDPGKSRLDTMDADKISDQFESQSQPDLDLFDIALTAAQSGPIPILSKTQETNLRLFSRVLTQGHHIPLSIVRIIRFQPLQNQVIQQRRVGGDEASEKIAELLRNDDTRDYEDSIEMINDWINRTQEICEAYAYCNLKLGRLPTEAAARLEPSIKRFEAAFKKVKRRKGIGETLEEVTKTLSGMYGNAITVLDHLRTLKTQIKNHQSETERKDQFERDRDVFWTKLAGSATAEPISAGGIHAE
ncbi:hypothetical protein [uncultured Cohaesibacter sp.]|uniref:hypothetical protein n=1 Tax=uncultured Cohaesibacter sp. TaxID=1002546 RepID=UPI0029C73584|nr:hypothetical protein [uncultured Cohaesibacter sp.]